MNLNELPKNPLEAMRVAANEGIRVTAGKNGTLKQMLESDHPISRQLIIVNSILRRASQHIADEELRKLIESVANGEKTRTLRAWNNDYHSVQDAMITLQLDMHFETDIDDEIFENAILGANDKEKIRDLMAQARVETSRAETLRDTQRRKVLHHISKIENELCKDISRFSVFTAAWVEVNELVASTGEALKPVADAIKTARTTVNEQVEGTKQLEEEEKPKQITKQ